VHKICQGRSHDGCVSQPVSQPVTHSIHSLGFLCGIDDGQGFPFLASLWEMWDLQTDCVGLCKMIWGPGFKASTFSY